MKLYESLADWFPLLSPVEEYREEAAWAGDVLARNVVGSLRTVLELGAGAGSNAFHLKTRFALTLTDASASMLAVSRGRNPECEHVVGDMRSLRLAREFDAVFVHDAVSCLVAEADLRAAMVTAFEHTRAGGASLWMPDHVQEAFAPGTDHGGSDGDGRALRYLEWTRDSDPTDGTYEVEFAVLLDDGSTIRVEHDHHRLGLFSRNTWMHLLASVGYRPERHVDRWQREVFVGRR